METVHLDVWLFGQIAAQGVETTVNITPGQTLILGSSPKAGSTATLLLTVRADEVDSGGDL